MSGKGSNPRPIDISWDKYATNFDLIFGRDNEKKNKEKSDLESGQSNRSCDGGSSDHTQTDAGQTKVS